MVSRGLIIEVNWLWQLQINTAQATSLCITRLLILLRWVPSCWSNEVKEFSHFAIQMSWSQYTDLTQTSFALQSAVCTSMERSQGTHLSKLSSFVSFKLISFFHKKCTYLLTWHRDNPQSNHWWKLSVKEQRCWSLVGVMLHVTAAELPCWLLQPDSAPLRLLLLVQTPPPRHQHRLHPPVTRGHVTRDTWPLSIRRDSQHHNVNSRQLPLLTHCWPIIICSDTLQFPLYLCTFTRWDAVQNVATGSFSISEGQYFLQSALG